ncbi:hypothetical protein DXG03_001073 [Asterophora parasitica]|uniref:Protein kinase domain-containing protein n=1 Tax=Asterophora parasitica TaxID=117018 RepID=A0A9P7KBZ7_9AGAR|nr:hypothetical protein DXG03_001073 [Asterophora parasitica]
MTTAEIEKWLQDNPPRRNPPEMSKYEMIQSAVSQPLPMISVEDALTTNFVLADFGAARSPDDSTAGYNHVVTSPDIRPPEIFLGGAWDEKVDIWTFGCLVYEIIAARPLFLHLPNGDFDLDPTENVLFFMMGSLEPFRAAQLSIWPLAINYFDPKDCSLKKVPHSSVPDLSIERRIELISDIVPAAEAAPMVALMRRCLKLDPTQRASAQDLLSDPFFEGVD